MLGARRGAEDERHDVPNQSEVVMAAQQAMMATSQLVSQAEALAATIARLRLLQMGVEGDPAVREALDRVADCLGNREVFDALDDQERPMVIGMGSTMLRQALELVDNPARAGAWNHTDPGVLQGQGAASMSIAAMISGAGLGKPGDRILDVGSGVAKLSIAFCNTYPESTVVAADPYEPSIALARDNIAEAGLGERITLFTDSVTALRDEDGFDLTWLPSFFISPTVLDDAISRIFEVSRSGATVIVGLFDVPGGPLAQALDALRTIRSGGTPLTAEDAIARLERAGFADVHEVERTWPAPIRFVAGRRP
jgi:hypothetical protein